MEKLKIAEPAWNMSRRDEFPLSPKSPATNKHKRYNGIPIRRAGGKAPATAHILERFPDKPETMNSPLVCGKAVEMAVARKPSVEAAAYDVF